MEEDTRWFASNDFWHDLECKVYTTEQLDAAAQEAADALNLLMITSSSTLLDMCCGNGRHSLELATRGHFVTGVDLNQGFLQVARQRAALKGVSIEFIRGDIRVFRRNSYFDAALVLWNAFGYFENDAEDLMALKSLHTSLRPGGQLLIQTHGKETTARRFVRKDWFEIGGRIILDQRWIERNWERMKTRYIIIDQGRLKEHVMSCRLYSPSDLERLLKTAGFDQTRFFGGLSGNPYDEKAFELVAIATK